MSEARSPVARAFAAAPDYEGNARVQREVAQRLAERISLLELPRTPKILEIGCGTGFLTRALRAPGIFGERCGDWLVTDLAPAMVERCREALPEGCGYRFAQLDAEQDEPAGGPFDLVCSSLAAQWFTDAPATLSRMRKWLKPDGHLVITTLGPESFAEWRDAHEAEGLAAGTPAFLPPEAYHGLDPEAVFVDTHVEHHANARAFLRALKAIGAGTAARGHRPLSAPQLRRVMARFDRTGCDVSYQVVTIHLRGAR